MADHWIDQYEAQARDEEAAAGKECANPMCGSPAETTTSVGPLCEACFVGMGGGGNG